MKKIAIFLVIAMIACVGCAKEIHETHEYNKVVPNVQPVAPRPTVEPVAPVVPVTPYVEPVAPVVPVTPYVEPVTPSVPDWVNNSLTATGNAVIDYKNSRNAGQAKMMARRAAKLDGMRQLLEQVLGLRVNSQTIVRDMVAESDIIDAESSGIIRGVQVVDEKSDGETMSVTVALPLQGVYSYINK
jgi:hypothetical protein